MKSNFTSRLSAVANSLRCQRKAISRKGIALFFLSFLFLSATWAQDIYAVSGSNLIVFNANTPASITFSVPLTGINSGQAIEGLDFRPATGQLFALGYVASTGAAQVYTINTKTGVAAAVGTPAMLAANMVRIGFDFNPTVDRIRVTSFGGQNYRLNPITGGIAATDGNLTYAPGDVHEGVSARIEAVAYTNNFNGATATTIYYFDYGFDDLASSTNPNGGVINTVGNSGISTISGAGLDLDILTNTTTGTNTAFLSARVATGTNNIYSVNLATGKASLLGNAGSIDEMAVYLAPPTPKIIYAVTGTNRLVSFNSNAPSTVLTTSAVITGITSGQVIEGLDFRPATGQLYALGYTASSGQTQVYTLDTTSGMATSAGAAITLAANMTNVAMDFNPAADRIRVTAATGQDYRLVPTTGALAATDGNLTYAPSDVRAANTPAVAAVAYTNSFPGSTATTIYYYDLGLNNLALSTNPNAGILNTVGVTGLSPMNASGLDMDISSNPGVSGNIGYLSANTAGSSSNNLYMLNLASGGTSLIGTIGSGITITDIAVYIAPPAPAKRVYAISGSNLIRFNSNTPGTIASTVALTGIANGQLVEGLDFRPANGKLYALGYDSTSGSTQIYTVDTTSGVATSVAAAIMLAPNMRKLGVDFNPMADRLRVTSATGQNYRLQPDLGTLAATDGNLNFATGDMNMGMIPNVNAVAYLNNVAGATSTAIYYYDFALDILATSTSPNTGALNTVGRPGITTLTGNGLDLDIVTDAGVNTAFLSANISGTGNNFYSVNLATSEVRLIGTIGATINKFAVSNAVSNGNRVAPESLISFTGNKEGSNSQLNWTTQTEVNNSYFILERSADNANFTAISNRIKSKTVDGNSSVTLNYSYNDFAPVKGMNYYRLVQVDKDGKSVYSKTVQLQFDGYQIITYPNPITSVINVNGVMTEKADLQVKLSDIYGRVINTTSLKNQEGNWNVKLNATGLHSGLYYVTVTSGNVVIHTETVQKN